MSSSRPSPSARDSAHLSPSRPSSNSQLRQRPNTGIRSQTTTSSEAVKSPPRLNERRSSVFSDMSDARKVLRDSTDDLFLPRPGQSPKYVTDHEASHWQSIPLGLALFPAVAGLLMKDAGAVVTDLTLLILAAVFLNWSVRVPWDWYRSAQAIQHADADVSMGRPLFDPIIEEQSESEDHDDNTLASSQEMAQPTDDAKANEQGAEKFSPAAEQARQELQIHELLALLSCFLGPAAGAWLLHAIRSQLSRPSEGLVSNYNLTVFLLAAEVRPLSHLIKMFQARTLYLQRVVATTETRPGDVKPSAPEILDLTKRLEDLETHVADSAVKAEKQQASASETENATAEQLTSSVRTSIQSELDALNRAVRKYEKRTTVSSLQTEQRLQELESRLQDALVLAAAAQRNIAKRPDNFILILLNWVSAAIVLPLQMVWQMARVPVRMGSWAMSFTRTPAAAKRERERDGMRMRRMGTGTRQGMPNSARVGLKEKRIL